MNAKAVGIAVAGLTLAVIAGVVWWESGSLTSPGPLHPSHAQVAELNGRDSCKVCHGDAGITMKAACIACHNPIQQQWETQTGIHGSLSTDVFAACSSCHTEHVGGSVQLVSDLSFQLSGIDQPKSYDHSHTEAFLLTDAHGDLSCVRCHEQAWSASLLEGQSRFLGEVQACKSCHEDPHHGELPECEECHGQSEPFKEAPNFDHSIFPLVDGHSIADCRECHESERFAEAPTDCKICHAEDFDLTLNPPHSAVGFGLDCETCHGITQWSDATYTHTDKFPLEGSHGELTCNQCHENAPDALAAITDATCAACHESPHGTQFVSAVPALLGVASFEESCSTCHDPMHVSFKRPEARMTPQQHAATGFPLVKPHDAQDCVECHSEIESDVDWAVLFPGRAAEDCEVCHGDPHVGQFENGVTQGTCLECHLPTVFQPTKYDIEMHARCPFPITGAHKAIACVSCHETENDLMRFVPTPTACADCHEDVHEGRFDVPRFAAIPTDKTGCARCHVTSSFHDVSWSSNEHELWTGFVLNGSHASVGCAACHSGDGPEGVEAFIIPDQACAACHQDMHAGQFEVRGVTDCARCHTETSFLDTTFVHNRDAKFALDEHHATLSCSSCHAIYETPGGPVTRYRPLGMECVDCHGDPDDIRGR